MFNMYKYLWFYGTKPVDSTATILPSNKEVFVKQNQSVLDAALKAGLDWPHDCKFGTCGQCKCKLVKGKIKPTSDYSYTLTKEELKEDYFLACQSRLTMDSQIEVELGDLVRVPPEKCNAFIKNTEMLTSDILKVTIETEKEVEHTGLPGMWAEPVSYTHLTLPTILRV